MQACYLPEFYEAETYITARLLQMAEKELPAPKNLDALVSQIEAEQGISYARLQREAIRKAATQQLLIVTGGPGTGKTTVMSGILSLFDSMKVKTQLAAPTGRAAKRLSEVTEREASTIHRLLEAQFDEATGLMSFFHDEDEPLKIDAMIVDETSMVDLQLMLSLLRALTPNCRLILVGDSAQLPPVGADCSPALDPSVLARFGDVEYGTMDEVVRQEAESGILFNATLVRCMLENGIYEIPHFETDYPDIEAVEGGEFLDKLQDCYAKYGRDETIVITRSNKRANRYNEGIRRNVTFAEEEIESNDMLMVVKNNYYFTERNKDCPMHFIANGDIARLKRLRRYEDFYGFRFADVVLEFPDYEDTEIECRILLDTIASESPALTREESSRLFYEVEKDYLDVKSKIKRFKEIRENPHFNALQVKFSYAVTCHKAQGGQWKAVFVDRCLFGDEPMTRDMLRWLYTALTRATDKLYLVNFDNKFYE
mgnify:CR=1 FL=1